MQSQLSPLGPGTVQPVLLHRTTPASVRAPKKAFVRREPDRTTILRRSFQAAFLLLNVWIGARFYLFVRSIETSGQSAWVPRPAGVEGWLPIAALMNLKYLVLTGTIPAIHPAGLFLLIAFLLISLIFRKAFCSWLCPIGTLSEWLWQGGQEIFGRARELPRWADIPLRSLKYILMGFFLFAVLQMSASDIRAFLESPYGIVADVKMLNFFRGLGAMAAAVIGVLVVLSVVSKNPWCRYLCPYGALMGLVSAVSPARVRRNADRCIDCAKCAKACPSLLPVDALSSVRSPECTGCLDCIAACPAKGALDFSLGRRRAISGTVVAIGIAVVFFGIVAGAKLTGHWQTTLALDTYRDLVLRAGSFTHPGM